MNFPSFRNRPNPFNPRIFIPRHIAGNLFFLFFCPSQQPLNLRRSPVLSRQPLLSAVVYKNISPHPLRLKSVLFPICVILIFFRHIFISFFCFFVFRCNQYAEKTPQPIIFADFIDGRTHVVLVHASVARGIIWGAAPNPGSIACCTARETSFRSCRQKKSGIANFAIPDFQQSVICRCIKHTSPCLFRILTIHRLMRISRAQKPPSRSSHRYTSAT